MPLRTFFASLLVVAAPCAVAGQAAQEKPVPQGTASHGMAKHGTVAHSRVSRGAAAQGKASRGKEKATAADPAPGARAKLEATRGQASVEDLQVKQLKSKVDAAESRSRTSAQELAERDRKIAELQRQLAAERHP